MLVNPYREQLAVYGGTRLLAENYDVAGIRIPDAFNPFRFWEVQALYAPIPGRRLGGVRARLLDQKGFVTFCNQRDLEVILGIGTPGAYCIWAGEAYVGPSHPDWFGLCADEDDLIDDLHAREMSLRDQVGGVLSGSLSIDRRVYLEQGSEYEENYVLLYDYDPDTGAVPDPRVETIHRRWIRSERVRIKWDRL